jgi:hypothetical protein
MDRYSKLVFTVIAVALSILVLQNAGVVPPVRAQANGQLTQVEICGRYEIDDRVGCVAVIGGVGGVGASLAVRN